MAWARGKGKERVAEEAARGSACGQSLMTIMTRGRKGLQGKMGGIWPLLHRWWQKSSGEGSTSI